MRWPHTHYDNLKVAPNASVEVIHAAYRVLAKKHHPDVNPTPDSVRVMQLLNEAWAVLGDPRRRVEHDAWIAEQERRLVNIQTTLGAALSPMHSGQTYTCSHAKPTPSRATGTKRTAGPSQQARSQDAESRSNAARRKPSNRNRSVRLRGWLGTAKGRTWTGAMVAALFLIAWLGASFTSWIEDSKASSSPTFEWQRGAAPLPERYPETSERPPASVSPLPAADPTPTFEQLTDPRAGQAQLLPGYKEAN